MELLKTTLLCVILVSIKLSAQFSLETILDEPFDQNMTSAKERLIDKNIEVGEVMSYKTILYYDWLEPLSVKIGFMFTKDGEPIGKVISNGKENEEDSRKLFDIAKAQLVKKFGDNYLERSMMGLTMLQWKDIYAYTIMLTLKGGKTMLTVLKK